MSKGVGVDDPERAADDLCDVLLAIEHVDYNALMEDDLQRLLSVRGTVRDVLGNYRATERRECRADAVDTEGGA